MANGTPQDSDGLYCNWFALGADVWNMPLPEASVDTVVTSWLLDVTGGDVKDLIAVVDYLLKPGGCWSTPARCCIPVN